MNKDPGDRPIQPAAQVDPRMMQAMYGGVIEEDEIDLLAYWNVIWGKRKFIFGVSLLAAFIAAGLSLMMPNIYRAEALLAPVGVEEKKGSFASMLGGLGGLASAAGISLGASSLEEKIAVLKSREFIWSFIKDEKLMPILFEKAWDKEKSGWIEDDIELQPSLWSAWRLLIEGQVIGINVDSDSGLVKLSVDWKDPELATVWVTKLVERINIHLREQAISQSHSKLEYLKQELSKTVIEENRQALYGLISAEQKQAMLANTQQDFVFRVIDPASVPDRKIKPQRAFIVIMVAFVVGFFCIVFVLIREGMRKRKEEDVSYE